MIANIRTLSIDERIQLVEDIWDSIAADQSVLPLTDDHKTELDLRLDALDADGVKGRTAKEIITDIKNRL